MKNKTLLEKVALLKDGQIVEINGLMFSAKRIDDDELQSPCLCCNVDCVCKGEVQIVCEELDMIQGHGWYLWLES